MSPDNQTVRVRVDEHILQLSNLDKVLYPETGFAKRDVIDYYSRIAPVILPHLENRALTLKRYPNGVDGKWFFEKNAPNHKPKWVRTARLPAPGSTMNRDEIDYLIIQNLAGLVWVANLAGLELHTPQWTVGPRGKAHGTDLLVFDLDPGEPADINQCREVACMLRDELAKDDLIAYPKTSGSKGMQVSVPIPEVPAGRTSDYAKMLAARLAKANPKLVTADMAKAARPGKIFVDWSQNNTAKTTICVYSLRARSLPSVSTPLSWDEVEGADPLRFTAPDVLDRVEQFGDLHAGALQPGAELPI